MINVLDERSVIPLYYQLKEILREKIKDGTWKVGLKVPSERELMEMYNVSRATVRKALEELMTDGLIYRKQGIGTFVSESKVIQNLIGELSFNQQALRQGLSPSSKVVYADLDTNYSKRIHDVFQLEKSEEIHKIIRVRLINGSPLVLETLHIPYNYAPKILQQDLRSIAIFEYLKADCNFIFTHSTLDIEPVAINDFEAQHLGIEIGQPALSLERIIYSNESAIVIQRRVMRGDRGKFSFTLSEGLQNQADYLVGLEFNG